MVPCTHSAFFRREKSRDKKGSRAKKSCDKKIALCVSWHLVELLLTTEYLEDIYMLGQREYQLHSLGMRIPTTEGEAEEEVGEGEKQ